MSSVPSTEVDTIDDGRFGQTIRIGQRFNKPLVVESEDPFSQTDVKYAGLSHNTRRRGARLEKAFTGQDGAASKKLDNEVITGYSRFDVVFPPYDLDYLAQIHEINPAHYAASWAKTTNIVGLGYNFELSDLYKLKMEDLEEKEKLKKFRKKVARIKIQMQQWLDHCNDEDDFLETMRKVWIDYESTGNGYIEIGRTVSGSIGYIGHVPSKSIRIRKQRDGFVQIFDGKKVVFFRNYGDRKTANPIGNDSQPNEIIHIKKYSPTSGYYGIPDIISAKAAVAGTEFATRYNLDYFENKAVPRYVIIVKGTKLDNNEQLRLMEFFESSIKGTNHRTIYVPLPADTQERKSSFEMKAVEAGQQDASFGNYRQHNNADILMAHRVPITKVSMADGSSLAAARDADKNFKEQVCRPEQRIIENKLNKVFAEYTDIFVLRFNELSLTDEDVQSQIDERYIRNQIVTPNEIRARKGLPGLDGGDEVVDLNAQKTADMKANQQQNRERDRQRANNASDGKGEARAAQGDGRQSQ